MKGLLLTCACVLLTGPVLAAECAHGSVSANIRAVQKMTKEAGQGEMHGYDGYMAKMLLEKINAHARVADYKGDRLIVVIIGKKAIVGIASGECVDELITIDLKLWAAMVDAVDTEI